MRHYNIIASLQKHFKPGTFQFEAINPFGYNIWDAVLRCTWQKWDASQFIRLYALAMAYEDNFAKGCYKHPSPSEVIEKRREIISEVINSHYDRELASCLKNGTITLEELADKINPIKQRDCFLRTVLAASIFVN